MPAPLLLLDGSLHRCRQPSKQHEVPFGHVLLSIHMFLSPMKQRRFVGGLGQESAKKKAVDLANSSEQEKFALGRKLFYIIMAGQEIVSRAFLTQIEQRRVRLPRLDNLLINKVTETT